MTEQPKPKFKTGYALIVCKICKVNRYVEPKQYRSGLPDTCIKCSKKLVIE